jgi:hypothetical protein
MDVELDPPQPAAVTEAVADALDEGLARPDPWWQAGIAEQLET